MAGHIPVVHYCRRIERDFLNNALKSAIEWSIEFPVLDTLGIESQIQNKLAGGLWNKLKVRSWFGSGWGKAVVDTTCPTTRIVRLLMPLQHDLSKHKLLITFRLEMYRWRVSGYNGNVKLISSDLKEARYISIAGFLLSNYWLHTTAKPQLKHAFPIFDFTRFEATYSKRSQDSTNGKYRHLT